MSYPEREQFEVTEERVPELRVVVKDNGALNGAAKNGQRPIARSQRLELAALGWEARRQRLMSPKLR
jgi:hypothetical protein